VYTPFTGTWSIESATSSSRVGNANLRIARRADLVGALEEHGEPALAVGLGELAADVVNEHGAMAAVVLAVRLGPTEHLGDERGHVLDVIGRHRGEHRGEQRIAGDAGVEHREQALERGQAADPVEQRGDLRGG
jgi:hypothetical protein